MSSRLLIFVLTLVAVATGGANLYLSGPDAVRTARAHLDAQLGKAANALPAVVASGTQRNLGLAADLAHAQAVQAAVTEIASQKRRPDQRVLDLARETLEARAQARGETDRNVALLVVATAGGAAEYRLDQGSEFNQEPGVPLVREALEGNTAHTLASFGGAFYRLVAVPVGGEARPAGAVAIGYPVDDRFVEGLRDTLGVDVTLVKGGQIVATSVPAESRGALVEGLVTGGTAFGFDELPQHFSLFGLVNLPLSTEPVHGARARTVKVAGIEGADVVLSLPSQAGLSPIADGQKRTVLFSGVVLVLGLLFTALAGGRGGSYDGDEVAALADDVERLAAGEHSVKATEYLPGDLGRLARAVNRLSTRNLAAAAAAPSSVAAPVPAPTEVLGHTPGPEAAPAGGFSFETEREPEDEQAEEPRDDEFGDLPAWARQEGSVGTDGEPSFDFGNTPGFGVADRSEPDTLGRTEEPDNLANPADLTAADEPSPGPAFHTGAPLPWELPSAGPSAALAHQPEPEPAAPSENDFSGLLDPTAGPAAIDPFVEALREAGRTGEQEAQPLYEQEAQQEFNPDATMVAAVPEALIRAISPVPAPRVAPAPLADPIPSLVSEPVGEDEDEAHFREVFNEFLRIRESCGEPPTNLTYERFAAKLHKNREQLIAKYQCRTVRFTVYVKEGKAALKASPIKA